MDLLYRIGSLLLSVALATASAQDAVRPDGVPKNAVTHDGHWYLPSGGPAISWDAAAAACKKNGGYLAAVNSPDERAFLESLIAAAPTKRFWLGGRRDDKGAWHWSQAGKDAPLATESVALVKRGRDLLGIAMRDVAHERDLAGLATNPQDLTVAGYICEWGDSQSFSSAPGGGPQIAGGGKAIAVTAGSASLRTVLSRGENKGYGIASIVATAKPTTAGSGFKLNLASAVVPHDVRNALNEVVALLQLRHGARIDGSITLAVKPGDRGYEIDTGTALVWALLADALVSGEQIQPRALVIGDINADGHVKMDWEFFDRVESLEAESGANIGVPAANEPLLRDLLIRGEFAAVGKNAIIKLGTFEEAKTFAAALPNAAALKASVEFNPISTLYTTRGGGVANVKHPKVLESLESAVAAQPNHLSAKLLLAAGKGKLGKAMSLEGSVAVAMNIAEPLLRAADSDSYPEKIYGNGDNYMSCVSQLRHVRTKLDTRSHAAVDYLATFGSRLERWAESRPTSTNGRTTALRELETALTAYRREAALLQTALLQGQKK